MYGIEIRSIAAIDQLSLLYHNRHFGVLTKSKQRKVSRLSAFQTIIIKYGRLIYDADDSQTSSNHEWRMTIDEQDKWNDMLVAVLHDWLYLNDLSVLYSMVRFGVKFCVEWQVLCVVYQWYVAYRCVRMTETLSRNPGMDKNGSANEFDEKWQAERPECSSRSVSPSETTRAPLKEQAERSQRGDLILWLRNRGLVTNTIDRAGWFTKKCTEFLSAVKTINVIMIAIIKTMSIIRFKMLYDRYHKIHVSIIRFQVVEICNWSCQQNVLYRDNNKTEWLELFCSCLYFVYFHHLHAHSCTMIICRAYDQMIRAREAVFSCRNWNTKIVMLILTCNKDA